MTIEQTNLFDNPLQALVRETTRNDDWINATKWCEYFGKEWYEFSRSKEAKRFLKALQDKLSSQNGNLTVSKITEVKGNKPKQTWVHPLVAIKLAEWLSPEFDIHVKQTFKRYLDGDIKLADDIVQRSRSSQDLKWLQKRIDGKVARKAFTDELKNHGVTGLGYAMNTNAIYKPILGKTAQELRDERQITSQSTRDDMTALELSAIGLAELAALARMQKSQAKGNLETSRISEDTASKVRTAIADLL